MHTTLPRTPPAMHTLLPCTSPAMHTPLSCTSPTTHASATPPRHACPLVDRMTDACENITFPQLLLRTVITIENSRRYFRVRVTFLMSFSMRTTRVQSTCLFKFHVFDTNVCLVVYRYKSMILWSLVAAVTSILMLICAGMAFSRRQRKYCEERWQQATSDEERQQNVSESNECNTESVLFQKL